jgi:hypothetical protein
VLLSSQLTRKKLVQLKSLQLPTTPCQLPDMKSDLDLTQSITREIASLGNVTDETLPSPRRCILQQKSFNLVADSASLGQHWDVVCTLTMCNLRGEVITRDTGLLPSIVLNQTAPVSLSSVSLNSDESRNDEEEQEVGDDVATPTEDIATDNMLNHTATFDNGVWTITIQCTMISGLKLSVALNGKEVHDSPLSIRRGKPELYFGENVGTIVSHSDLHSGFLSSMSIENLRSMEGSAVVWRRDNSVPRGQLESFVVMELTSSPKCLLSHIVLKSSKSDQYRLFYRSSNFENSDDVQLNSNDHKESETVSECTEWIPFEFLTPDWTDVKEDKVLIVDIVEEQCKDIGYVDAIRLEVKSTTKKSANSFHGVNVYGWNV